jgi:hypothetical protein|nr:MAG TPA: large terminase [Caudoviricetes sp.]
MNRVTKRYMARYTETFTYACRGYGKTTCIVSDKCNKGILWPGEITGYYAPIEAQAAPLASKAFQSYKRNTPLLAAHWDVNSDAREHFKISTPYGSKFIMDIDRGLDTSGVVAEECAQEDKNPFNFSDFNQIVLGTNRLQHMVNGIPDSSHIDNQIHYITSSSRKENPAFEECAKIRKKMNEGGSAYALWIPWQVPVLCRMKPYSYYSMLKGRQTAEEFMRECESKCTGASQNPVLADKYLQAAKTVQVMEDKHCGDDYVRYYIGNDVSYRKRNGNALCAEAVIKAYAQKGDTKLKKDCVYITDMPPLTARDQARRMKYRWAQYRKEGTPEPILIVDSWQFGEAIVQQLHTDLNDGLPPLCTVNNDERYREYVLPNAVPCIYALFATSGRGGADPNIDMIDYTVREFEHGNVGILTTNIHEGTRNYKMAHNLKDDLQDSKIQHPYIKTAEFCKQIANLQRKRTSSGWTQEELNKHVNKDMWSAFTYAMWMIKKEEDEILASLNRRKSSYQEAAEHLDSEITYAPVRTRSVRRLGRGAIV